MTNLRDWPEDFGLENGKYHCLCGRCGEQFLGHNRRVLCKVCDQYLSGSAPAERDPRLDPVAGDVLKPYNPFGSVRNVLTPAFQGHIKILSIGWGISTRFVSMENWRKWAKTAEIIRRGDAEPGATK